MLQFQRQFPRRLPRQSLYHYTRSRRQVSPGPTAFQRPLQTYTASHRARMEHDSPTTDSIDPPSQSLLTPITTATSRGTTTQYIRRSYPKGKPEKLMAGLQRLLSSKFWALSPSHDAIHLVLTLPASSSSSSTNLIDAIVHHSQSLDHHPHISSQQIPQPQTGSIPVGNDNVVVIAVTCTTHVPYGLSLKDVKLAELITEIVERTNGVRIVNGDDMSSSSSSSSESAEGVNETSKIHVVGEELVQRNEKAAADARANPESTCARAS